MPSTCFSVPIIPGSTHLLDVVVAQSATVLELLASEDKTLLVWGNALLVLDLALHIVDGVRGLDLKGDGLARQGLNEAVTNPALANVVLSLVCAVCGRGYGSRLVGFAVAVADFEVGIRGCIRTSAL